MNPTPPSNAHLRARIGLAAVMLAGCSTVLEIPERQTCVEDSDCDPGLICNSVLECEPDTSDLLTIRFLGLEIREGPPGSQPLRLEIEGCDREVNVTPAPLRQLNVPRGPLTQTFDLQVFNTPTEDPQLSQLLQANFELSQPSRFERSPGVTRRSVLHPDPLSTEDAIVPTTMVWPRFHPDNELPDTLTPEGFVLWTVLPVPNERGTEGALRYQMLVPPIVNPLSDDCQTDEQCCSPQENCAAACVLEWNASESTSTGRCRPVDNPTIPYDFTYEASCDRGLAGRVSLLPETADTEDDLTPLGGATINVSYAGPLSISRLRNGNDSPIPQCEKDADCIVGQQVCNTATHECELDLAGRAADSAATDNDTGRFSGRVFTYCEGQIDQRLTRTFTATVVPPSPSIEIDEATADPPQIVRALPSVNFEFDATFDPEFLNPDTNPNAELARDLCIPDWGEAISPTIVLAGQPQHLAGSGLGNEYICCDTSCLPMSADVAGIPPAPVETCTGHTGSGTAPTIRFATDLVVDEALEKQWNRPELGCQPPLLDDNRVAGSLSQTADCNDPALCSVNLARGTEANPRRYEVRLESPPGSVVRSLLTTIDVGSSAETIELSLPPRHLLSGFVRLDDSICSNSESATDCANVSALVVAERLRVPGENALPPFFHELPTFWDPTTGRNGRFVMPLDPGIYAVTALPGPGSLGGPATITVVDLTFGDGEWDGVLQPGVLSTIDVSSFDRSSTQAVPLDLGSWFLEPIDHDAIPGDHIDLNDPAACWTDLDASGCRIRRMIAGGSLPLSQVRQIRFASRDLGGCQ